VNTKALSAEEAAFARSLVLFEDETLIALDKPPGLSSQGGRIAARTLDDLLAAFTRPGGARPRLAHRLDRDTSGVILAARTKPAAAFLGRALMARKVGKTYLALVAPGAPEPPAGRNRTPLRRFSIGRDVRMEAASPDDPAAETADTGWRTLAAGEGAALVELRPHTGRMHQLRVHMAALGRPIVGDARYGGALVVGGAAAPRLMLHAWRIKVPLPAGGERLIEAPVPSDFAALAGALGLESALPIAERSGA
jgi:RluA family pseudouridine synthase